MPTAYRPFPFTGGMDRSRNSLRADKGTFFSLEGFRQVQNGAGQLEQVPYFYATTLSQGTYWSGTGSATEATTVEIWHASDEYVLTKRTIRKGDGTQLQVLFQITQPATETIYTGCRLVVNNITGLGINLGATLDVEMTGAAAFRWRKNGGAWVAGVPSTAGVAIDGGNATLYFLANTGFAGTEAWAWQRTDTSYVDSTKAFIIHEFAYSGTSLLFFSLDTQLMSLDVDTGGTSFVVSAGYRRIYGRYLAVFDDHLVIGAYSTSNSVSVTSQPRARTVAWSDKADHHNFVATDINEADTLVLSAQNTNQLVVLGILLTAQSLYIVTNDGLFVTAALGLPLVFSFTRLSFPALYYAAVRPVTKAGGSYYISAITGLYRFTNGEFTEIGRPVGFHIYGKNVVVDLAYLESTGELFVRTAYRMFVYQETVGTWYSAWTWTPTRLAMSVTETGSSPIICGGDLTYYKWDTGWTQTPVYDYNFAFASRKITFHALGDRLGLTKEILASYLGCFVTSKTGGAAAYSTDANCQFKLYWSVDDYTFAAAMTTDTNAVYVNTNVDGTISYPRTYFRSLRLEIRLVGLVSGKPPGQATIQSLEPFLREEVESVER